MNKITLMLRFLKGNRLTYLGALLAVMGNVVLATAVPMVIRVTLDSILGDLPLELPDFLIRQIGRIGGVDFIRQNLWVLLIVLIGLTLVQGLMQFTRAKLASITGESSAKRMRDRVYLHVLRQPYDYHVKSQTGDIIQRCTSDIETTQHFVANRSVEAISIIFQVLVVLGIMLSLNVPFTVISVVLIPLILILLMIYRPQGLFGFREMTLNLRGIREDDGLDELKEASDDAAAD